MRIAWICQSGVAVGEPFLTSTIDTLASIGEVLAISGSREPAGPYVDSRIICSGFTPGKVPWLAKVIRHSCAWDIHSYNASQLCRRRCLPLLRDISPDVVWVDYATTAIMCAPLLAALETPFIVAVHGYDVSSCLGIPSYSEQFTAICNKAASVVCASDHTRRLSILAGVEETKPVVIRLSLDNKTLRRDHAIALTPWPSFVHLGRLAEQKNPIATLHAFAIVHKLRPNARLTFIGDGPLRLELEQRVRALNLHDAVTLTGALPNKEAWAIAQSHWVFCQHSSTGPKGDQEGFAISPAEAALLEIPVVSTLHNGIPEHVIDGETGFLVREFDYEQMADRMLALIADPSLRQRMGHRGRENISELCSPETRLKALTALLTKVSQNAEHVARHSS